MAMIDDFNPRKTRANKNIKSGSTQRVNLMEEVRVNPVPKTIPKEQEIDTTQEMISQYAYDPKKEKESTESAPKEHMIISEQSALYEHAHKELASVPEAAPKESSEDQPKYFFDLWDMSYMCEEHLRIMLFEPQDIKEKKIYNLEKEFIKSKLEVYADYTQGIELKNFKDELYYYKGEVLIPEELFILTGFLREYFEIKTVHVLYRTGDIIKENSLFCSFWHGDVLDKFFNEDIRGLSRPKMKDKNDCLRCNLECAFRYRKQMSND